MRSVLLLNRRFESRSPAFDALLLDFDGTLCDTLPVILHALKTVLSDAAGGPPPDSVLGELVASGKPLEEMLRLARGGPMTDAEVSILCERYRSEHRAVEGKLAPLFTGVPEVLSRAKAGGVRCVVVSNKGTAAVERMVAVRGIAPLLSGVVGDAKKPATEPFEVAAGGILAGTERERILMVGDTEADLRFASALGVRAAFAAYGYGSSGATGDCFVLGSFSELPGLLFPT